MQIWTRERYGKNNEKVRTVKQPFVTKHFIPHQIDDFFEYIAKRKVRFGGLYSLIQDIVSYPPTDGNFTVVFSASEEKGLRKIVEMLYMNLDHNLSGFFNALFRDDLHLKEKKVKVEFGFIYTRSAMKNPKNRRARLCISIKKTQSH